MSDFFESEGFDEFSKLLEKYSKRADEDAVLEVLEYGAEEFAKDLRALPKPRSTVRKAGYTHIIDTMTTRRRKDEIEVGWGKYYGPMLERGTRKMRAQPHVRPLFEKNSEKYYKLMEQKLFS